MAMKIGFILGNDCSPGASNAETQVEDPTVRGLIFLSRALLVRGHEVHIFGPHKAAESGGVQFRPTASLVTGDSFDSLILYNSWFAGFDETRAKVKLFWSTRLDLRNWDQTAFRSVRGVICFSPLQRDFLLRTYTRVNPSNVCIIPFGVCTELRSVDEVPHLPKDRSRLILYGGPTSGDLAHLVRIFATIRSRVPKAELLLPSRFSLWNLPGSHAAVRTGMLVGPGITYAGPLSAERLTTGSQQAVLCAFPCVPMQDLWFTGLEFAAAGILPVSTETPAISGILGNNAILINGIPGEKEYDDAFAFTICNLLENPGYRSALASKVQNDVRRLHTWDRAAQSLESLVESETSRHSASAENDARFPRAGLPAVEPKGEPVSISVVVPFYNQSQYLQRCISSILWQLGEDDEMIFVNDGSSDLDCETEDWLSGLPQAKYLVHETRKGVSTARNYAIQKSKGTWIKFLDADDLLAPFALSLLRHPNMRLDDDTHVVVGYYHRVLNGNYHDCVTSIPQQIRMIRLANPFLPSSAFVRRAALDQVGLFDERIDFEEDWDLWLRLHQRFGFECFAVVDAAVCYYWLNLSERSVKARSAMVEGIPVREYFRRRYGADPVNSD